MRNFLMATAAAAVLATAVAGAATPAMAGIQDFYVRNNTGDYVWYVYVSPSSSSDWEEDVLGSDVLPPHQELLIEMEGYRSDECLFDVKVVDENGYSREYWQVDLCQVLYVDFN